MLRNFIIIGLILVSNHLIGQVNGPSASKLTTFNVQPVAKSEAEFEPTWNYSRNLGPFSSDSVVISTNISWRLTYGLFEGVELGISTSSDFSNLCIGSKVTLFEKEKLAMSAMGGMGFNLENKTIASDQSLLSSYAVGLIASYQINDKNSIDANIQTYKTTGDSPTNILMSADWGGYALGDKFQLIFGASYNSSSSSSVVVIYPGFAVEAAENFILVLAPAITLYGADIHGAAQTFGIGLSFTSCWK